MSTPWWIERVRDLPGLPPPGAREIGPLWRLSQRILFIRENVDAALLLIDFEDAPDARASWAVLLELEAAVHGALAAEVERVAEELRCGALTVERFRAGWEALGFAPHEGGAATPADDYLDALTRVSLLTTGEPRPPSGTVNLSSRARRISEFLVHTRPGSGDVVIDLGSGNGKFALTVAASTAAQVRGVELGRSYVEAAERSGRFLGLRNLSFAHGDVRDQDLSAGTIFYLYHPFGGAVADAVAGTLGELARRKAITVYLQGPQEFLNAFLGGDAFGPAERHGEFSEILVRRSRPVYPATRGGVRCRPDR